jgi:hypothetical protein
MPHYNYFFLLLFKVLFSIFLIQASGKGPSTAIDTSSPLYFKPYVIISPDRYQSSMKSKRTPVHCHCSNKTIEINKNTIPSTS